MADNFKLPGSSYEEIVKIIKAYSVGKEGQPQTLDAIAQTTGMDRTIVSRNNGFLMQMELLSEGAKKTPTDECFSLGRAYTLNISEEIQKIWRRLIDNCEFLTRMLSAIKIRNGMDKTSFCSHILYSAGSTTSAAKVGANTIIEIFKAAGIVGEEDGKIIAIDNSADREDVSKESHTENLDMEKATAVVGSVSKPMNCSNGIINININIDASVSEIEELSEKIKLLLKSINE